jgi:hypothetical protein
MSHPQKIHEATQGLLLRLIEPELFDRLNAADQKIVRWSGETFTQYGSVTKTQMEFLIFIWDKAHGKAKAFDLGEFKGFQTESDDGNMHTEKKG